MILKTSELEAQTSRASGMGRAWPAQLCLPFRAMDSNVGWTVTSLEVENSILSSALRSIPLVPSSMLTDLVLKTPEERCESVTSRLVEEVLPVAKKLQRGQRLDVLELKHCGMPDFWGEQCTDHVPCTNCPRPVLVWHSSYLMYFLHRPSLAG